MNGWTEKGIVGLVGAAAGAGLLLLTMSKAHDVGVGLTAAQEIQIQDLLAFKARIDAHVEEWRGDQARYTLRMDALETASGHAAQERAAMLRWMERVSAKMGVEPPNLPQSSAKRPQRPGLQAADGP